MPARHDLQAQASGQLGSSSYPSMHHLDQIHRKRHSHSTVVGPMAATLAPVVVRGEASQTPQKQPLAAMRALEVRVLGRQECPLLDTTLAVGARGVLHKDPLACPSLPAQQSAHLWKVAILPVEVVALSREA